MRKYFSHFFLPFSLLLFFLFYFILYVMERLAEYTNDFLIQENKVPDLSWVNVAIAASFLIVNGKYTCTHILKE